MNVDEREQIQRTFIRVCKDSRYRMEPAQAAHFTAKILEISALDVWIALGTDNMQRIATGGHPCLSKP